MSYRDRNNDPKVDHEKLHKWALRIVYVFAALVIFATWGNPV